jgi:pimeloyl-ACP methyl ester carboxylesterase
VPAPSPDGRTIRFVDIGADRLRLRTAVRGSGRPLLLITGLGASLDLGAPFERELAARGLQTISFDAPGTGQSTAYTWPRRMPGIARTAERMLDALGYRQVDVLGASLGGVIAQQFAHQAPHRVRRLVLAATGPGLGGIPGSPRALLALATPRRRSAPFSTTITRCCAPSRTSSACRTWATRPCRRSDPSARTYSARSRPNLTIRPHCLVNRVLVAGDRAVGVDIAGEGEPAGRWAAARSRSPGWRSRRAPALRRIPSGRSNR